MQSANEGPPFAMTRLVDSDQGSELEVPAGSVGQVYRSSERLLQVVIGDRVYLKFGSTGLFGSILLDPTTGRVLEAGKSMDSVSLVNTSLSHFIACLSSLVERFPFYSSDSEDDEWESAALGLESVVRQVDQEAYDEGSFWYEIRWSIASGDFAEE
ncbi:SUKH-4 family immunity protein [Streptomyces sp. NPDC058685]|uniref:SUKH-4 family immunity protein n=1 Tax=Streptomyces sp. NPDC058685 TaxID=3346598 RepID=UPI003656F226